MQESRLMEMLTGYAAAHQHPVNIAVHMVGIPVIMFGVMIPLSWVSFEISGVSVTLAHAVLLALFVFYFTLDNLFAVVFLVFSAVVLWLAQQVAAEPMQVSGTIAAAAFVGGYAAQFIGHAIEKSPPVILKHPVQANLAAPFFTVVEAFKLLGLRDDLFRRVQQRIAERQSA